MTYKEKLLDPRWQKRRLEILQRDNFTCVDCGDTKSTLHVHHEMYFKGDEPWDAPDEILNCICDKCHSIKHAKLSELEKFLLGALISRDMDMGTDWRMRFRNLIIKMIEKRNGTTH